MQRTRVLFLCFAITASGAAAVGCGSSTAPTNGRTGPHTVVIDANADLQFRPSPDTIVSGDTVQFAWHAVPHNVIWDNTPAAVKNIGSGDDGFTSGDSSRVLTVSGTYTYHCAIHDGMNGVIVVQ